jgi:hypothetical protein
LMLILTSRPHFSILFSLYSRSFLRSSAIFYCLYCFCLLLRYYTASIMLRC